MILSAKFDSPPVDDTTYRQLVGILIYLSGTRPYINFTVSYISHFMIALKVDHWMRAKCVLCYVKGTTEYELLYSQSSNLLMRVLYHLHNILGFDYSIWDIKHATPLLKSYCS